MNNLTHHVRRLGLTTPSVLRLLLTGFSDRLAFDYGFIDTNLPFEKAREAVPHRRVDAEHAAGRNLLKAAEGEIKTTGGR